MSIVFIDLCITNPQVKEALEIIVAENNRCLEQGEKPITYSDVVLDFEVYKEFIEREIRKNAHKNWELWFYISEGIAAGMACNGEYEEVDGDWEGATEGYLRKWNVGGGGR